MILDDLRNLKRYRAVLPALEKIEAFLAEMPLAARANGRHELDGDRLYVNIGDCTGKGRSGARLEIHRRYADVQIALDNRDVIGWKPLQDCRQPAAAYDASSDIGFFGDASDAWFDLVPGQFSILFPEDAHAPLAAEGPVRKAIFKVML